MRLSEKQSDFLWMVNDLLNWIGLMKDMFDRDKIYLRVTSWTRTPIEQKLLFENGATKTLNSKHLSGLAVDLLLMKDGFPIDNSPVYRLMGEYWERIGGRWGGRWKMPNGDWDVYHFEYNEKRRRDAKKDQNS